MKFCRRNAFTLVEMLAVVAVTGVLIGMVVATANWGMNRARLAREISAARSLVAAYSAATTDNDGQLLAGYDDRADGYKAPDGASIPAEANHRYPFRLAPYFDYALQGTILVNRNRAQFTKLHGDSSYMRSLYPALGMNQTYVGGEYRSGVVELPSECVTRISGVVKASMTLVFASAGQGQNETKIDGYFKLIPPNIRVTLWTGGDDAVNQRPESYGNVDFRYSNQAVCAFLDGSVRMMSPKDLRDMRYWSPRAQEADNPGYTAALAGPVPGRGNGR